MTDNRPTITIHQPNEEGIITISSLDGRVVTLAEERPAWAAGLAVAHLHERTQYYSRALGPTSPVVTAMPTILAATDLQWTAVDEEGDAVIVEADLELRSAFVSAAYELDTDADAWDGITAGVTADMLADATLSDQPPEETLGDAAFPLGQIEGSGGRKAVNE